MRRIFRYGFYIGINAIALIGCRQEVESVDAGDDISEALKDRVVLEFSMSVNQSVYEHSDFGEPPQLAIWLEQPDSGRIRTVWVSHRTGKNQWKGKIECLTALPYWKSRHEKEISSFRERSLLKRLIDALTGATPKGGFRARIRVPRGSRWAYYIEVNVSGDFNVTFPSVLDDGTPDPDGNGQPSLIFKGEITAKPNAMDIPKLIGRTDQWVPVDTIIHDLTGITTAKDIFYELEVFCYVRINMGHE